MSKFWSKLSSCVTLGKFHNIHDLQFAHFHLGVVVMNVLTVSCEGESVSRAFRAQHDVWAGPQLSWFVVLFLSVNNIQLI